MSELSTVQLSDRDRALLIACTMAIVDAPMIQAEIGRPGGVERYLAFRQGLEERLREASLPAAEDRS